MLAALRLWLNESQEYWSGVVLYAECDPNLPLLQLMKQGPTPFTIRRLKECIIQHCEILKGNTIATQATTPVETPSPQKSTTPNECANQPLYDACLLEANKVYKETMNKRAVLFSMCKPNGYEDINRPDLRKLREPLAIEVVVGYQKSSKLFDIANYVFVYGKLPNDEEEHNADDEMNAIPDEMVKQKLDNLRKSYNKLKAKDSTAERVELMQRQQKNIKKLEARWHLLKSTQ